MAALVVTAMGLSFVSCSDDDDDDNKESTIVEENKLIGWWTSNPWEGWGGYQFCSALHFINNTEVDYYEYVANGPYWEERSTPFPALDGWYIQYECYWRYNYYMSDNKLYLTDDNDVMVFDCSDGAPSGYTKIK